MSEFLIKRGETLPARAIQALEARGLTLDALRCEMEMAHGEGSCKPRRIAWGIQYHLPLCRYCGRANPQDICPAKLNKLLDGRD
jgi:hypothetical protein